MNKLTFFQMWHQRVATDPAVRGRCFYCGSRMTDDHKSPFLATKEHVIPRHASGSSQAKNLVKACAGCNGAKNGFSVDRFREWFGEEFFCEKIIGEKIPSTNSPQVFGKREIDQWYGHTKQQIANRMNSKSLTYRLNFIIEEGLKNANS